MSHGIFARARGCDRPLLCEAPWHTMRAIYADAPRPLRRSVHPIWKASWRGALANSATRHPLAPSCPLAEADFLQGTKIVSSKTGLRQVGSHGHAVVHAADGRAARAVKKHARARRRVAHALGRSEAARTPRGRKGRARVTLVDPGRPHSRAGGGGWRTCGRAARAARAACPPARR